MPFHIQPACRGLASSGLNLYPYNAPLHRQRGIHPTVRVQAVVSLPYWFTQAAFLSSLFSFPFSKELNRLIEVLIVHPTKSPILSITCM